MKKWKSGKGEKWKKVKVKKWNNAAKERYSGKSGNGNRVQDRLGYAFTTFPVVSNILCK